MKKLKYFTMLALGVALVSGSRSMTGSVNASTNTATAANISRYTHIPTVATIDRREVVRGPQGGTSLITWSTDANGAGWIDSINLTNNK